MSVWGRSTPPPNRLNLACTYACVYTCTHTYIHTYRNPFVHTHDLVHKNMYECECTQTYVPPPPLAARSDRYNNDNLSEEEEVVENEAAEEGNPFIKFDSQSRRMSILLSDWSLNSSFDSQDETKRKFSEASSTTVTSEEGRLVEVTHHTHASTPCSLTHYSLRSHLLVHLEHMLPLCTY